jgi:hypothetical protein
MIYQNSLIIKKNRVKKIFYYMIFFVFMIFYTMFEMINLYVQYRTYIYLNDPKFEDSYAWLVNSIVIHNIIKSLFSCLKLRDFYVKCKKRKIN